MSVDFNHKRFWQLSSYQVVRIAYCTCALHPVAVKCLPLIFFNFATINLNRDVVARVFNMRKHR